MFQEAKIACFVAFPSSPEQGRPASGRSDVEAGSGPCLVALGRRLREAREAHGLAVTVLAERLRIGVEQLQALETADRERLPESVFVIAQARRIATALQLDITAELQALRASDELKPGPRSGSLRPLPEGQASHPNGTTGVAAAGRGIGALLVETRPHLRRCRPAVGRFFLLGAALLLAVAAVRGGLWGLGGGVPVPQGSSGPAPSAAPAASSGF